MGRIPPVPFPKKKYQIVYADPPYSYYNDSSVGPNCTTIKGIRRPPYNVMSSSDIMELPVNNITDENCILFIWTTDYHLEKCLHIIKSWGFEYKTIGFAWLKENKQGNPICFAGAYTLKSGVELCLLATKGSPHQFVIDHKVRALIKSQRRKHSQKPDETRDRIVQLVGNLPRIELFARQKTPGWDVWGNEI